MGELSRATGLTVRALHHYDEIGLLVPSERTFAGYRIYSEADVRRLYAIVALRRLGLGLAEIGDVLAGKGIGLDETVRRQIAHVERQLVELRELHDRLTAIREAVDREEEPSIEHLTKTMEAITMHEKYYTPDQLERLRRRGDELGVDEIEMAQREWGEIFGALRAEMEAGTDPADPRLDPHRRRSRELLHAFTGGDRDIIEAMDRMWVNEDPEALTHGMVDRELAHYLGRVLDEPRRDGDGAKRS